MIIRPEQMQRFDEDAGARFQDSLVEHVKKTFPVPVAGADEAGLRKFVAEGIERAREWGFRTRGPVRAFIEYKVILGHEFDRDPMLYWIADILRDREGLDEGTQAARLHLHISTYQALVYGPAGEYAAGGLFKMASAPRELLAELGRAYDLSAAEWLKSLHPRKCVYAGPEAVTNLIGLATERTATLGLPPLEGRPLVLGLMFGFGSGILSDPLFPWTALDAADTPAGRLDRLFSRAQAYLRRAVQLRSEK